MLTVRDLNQFHGASHTLRDVELEVREGDCLCVMGRNGVGKTTLLRTIMGQLRAASGSIVFDGVDFTSRPPESRAGAGIGYVPQGREIFPQLTVEENLLLPLAARRRRQKVPELVFRCFPILRDMLRRRGGDLSGGQQQQLALGRALVLEPRLLVLDEPTEGIQPNIVDQIGTILERLRVDEKITILLVEQRLPMARRIAQRFCLLDRGAVVARGGMDELRADLVNAHLKV